MSIQIKKAVRERVWLKIAATGAAGSGKTYGTIGVAKGLAPTGKILVLDTENRSASYYAGATDAPGAWDFDVVEIEAPFTPMKYLEALQAAIDGGYEVIVIDSLTHEWAASGGILDQKSLKDARGDNRGNGFANWQEMKRIHNRFMEVLLQSHIHVLATLRSKMEYVQEEVGGKKEVRKLGLSPIAQDETEYEFGVVFDVERNTHLASASKDRTGLFEGRSFHLNEAIGRELRSWRDSGAELAPVPAKVEAPAPVRAPQAEAAQAREIPGVKNNAATARPAPAPAPPPAPRRRAAAAPAPAPAPQAAPETPDFSSHPDHEAWVEAMVQLAQVTVGMPEATRNKLVGQFDAEGPASLESLKAEIASIKSVMNPEVTTAGGTFTSLPRGPKAPISQVAADFVDDVDPDTDEAAGGITKGQYEQLLSLIQGHGINRDSLRAYCAKLNHLLPGKNGPTLARMTSSAFAKLREDLANNSPSPTPGKTWAQVRIERINATPSTPFKPAEAAS